MVYWCQKQAKIGYCDKSANGFYKECDPVEDLEAGDLVFHHNGIKCSHVGIYNGDGWVIESMGRDDGVVKTRRKEGYWNRQGRLRKLADDYGLRGDVNLDGKVTSADAAMVLRYVSGLIDLNDQQKKNADFNRDGKITKEDADAILNYVVGKHQIRVIGGSVNVRKGYTTLTKKLGVAHRGDMFPYLGTAPNGWYKIRYKGKEAYISNRKDLTVCE